MRCTPMVLGATYGIFLAACDGGDGAGPGRPPALEIAARTPAPGRVHISYNTQAAAAALRYATCAVRCGLVGSWQAATVDETAIGVGFWTSVAIDGNGRVHVSYVDVTAGGSLKYIQ